MKKQRPSSFSVNCKVTQRWAYKLVLVTAKCSMKYSAVFIVGEYIDLLLQLTGTAWEAVLLSLCDGIDAASINLQMGSERKA